MRVPALLLLALVCVVYAARPSCVVQVGTDIPSATANRLRSYLTPYGCVQLPANATKSPVSTLPPNSVVLLLGNGSLSTALISSNEISALGPEAYIRTCLHPVVQTVFLPARCLLRPPQSDRRSSRAPSSFTRLSARLSPPRSPPTGARRRALRSVPTHYWRTLASPSCSPSRSVRHRSSAPLTTVLAAVAPDPRSAPCRIERHGDAPMAVPRHTLPHWYA